MQYKVRALSPDHQISLLTIDAQSESDARIQVEAQGMFAAAIQPVSNAMFGVRTSAAKSISVVLFSQELLALLKAGLSIVEALEALLEKNASAGLSSILNRLLTCLREGKRFSDALAEQSDIFSPLYIGIVKAAEGTGDLPQSLARYVDYQQRVDIVRNKIISAAIYPMILLLVGGGVSCFLIGYVVPRFAEVYQGAGRNLPWMSALLLSWGEFAGAHTTQLVTGVAATATLAFFSLKYFFAGDGMARLLHVLPGIGERVRIYELSRLYLTMGMLLEGGIAIVATLDTVQGMVSANIKTNLQLAKEAIQSGAPLSSAFEAHQLTTPISLRMLRVGEKSGEMGGMLTQSAEFYDGEISRWIDRFTRTFEPLLMAVIGIIVGGIVVLLYMPIFDLAGSMS
jgi:general secretion pathway protein F